MKILVTGSTGHLGEALVRTLTPVRHDVIGVDRLPSPFTNAVGTIADRSFVASLMRGIDAVLHTATLHKPHIATHSRQDFVDTNITGTLNLLEEAGLAGVKCFVFTSTTSVFGDALTPPLGKPAAWITEAVEPVPKNIYGATKKAAEDLCQIFHRNHGLPCLVLRTSRFFPEEDDRKEIRDGYTDGNSKANEFLYRRVDIEDVVSATTPFREEDLAELRSDAPAVLRRRVPEFEAIYAACNWQMLPVIDRVYVNARARIDLGWQPRYDFRHVLDCQREGLDPRSPLARLVGSKGYHAGAFQDGLYPVD